MIRVIGIITWVSILLVWPAAVRGATASDPAVSPQQTPDENDRQQEPGVTPTPSPWSPAKRHLDVLATAVDSLALIRPEAEGTDRDMSDLESWLLTSLTAHARLRVLGPDEVAAKAGVVFAISGSGLGRMAERSGTKAALFVRLIQSAQGAELVLLAADQAGTVILDQAIDLASLPAPAPRPELALVGQDPVEDPAGADQNPTQAGSAPDPDAAASKPVQPPWVDQRKQENQALFAQRRLSLAPTGANPHRYRIVQAEQDLGELDLVRLAGRTDLEERLKTEIDSLQFMRALGMGLTLAGFSVAGLAMPLFHSSDSAGEWTGGVVTGIGALAGTAGVVLWLIYGAEAVTAGGPHPLRHILRREEAEQLVRSYNDTLRRELGLGPESSLTEPEAEEPGVSFLWLVAPTRDGMAAQAMIRF